VTPEAHPLPDSAPFDAFEMRDTRMYVVSNLDKMKYHNTTKGNARVARQARDTRASEFDVKCLLWMSKLVF
jgi:hypothetical protein